MAYAPSNASVTVVNGYPIFTTKDQNGTPVMPSGNYVWNSTSGLWTPWQADANGNARVSMASGSLDGGTLSATTTAAKLGSSQACSEVLIQADPSNTDDILIGGSTSQTIVLSPGASETVPASNVDLIYAKSASGSQTVNYMWRS